MKKLSAKRLFVYMIVLLVCCDVAIVICNNMVADKIRVALIESPLPPKSGLLSSVAIAGKIYGCGNGMQYTGAIIISSSLELSDLFAYYKGVCNQAFVEKPKESQLAKFFNIPEIGGDEIDYYIVRITLDREDDILPFNSTEWAIRNHDIRGH